MSKIAFIYPGQGAQAVGMGQDFYENSPLSKVVFDQASEAVSLDLKKLCFEENDLLNKTEYTQVAMVTACIAMTRAVEAMGLHADMTAGLSLGEYCAIAAAGGMCDMDAVRTVRSRGIFMEHAAPEGTGAMSAVLGLDASVIEEVLDGREGVSIANYNCPGQIVITGQAEAVAKAGEALKEAGARRVLPLKVSGPFHSAMLKGAGDKLEKELKNIELKELKMPYVANCNASYIYDNSQIKELLKKQISAPVKFMQSVEKMIDDGVDTFVEIGPGKTLSKFVKKINKDVTVINIEKVDDLEKLKGLEIC